MRRLQDEAERQRPNNFCAFDLLDEIEPRVPRAVGQDRVEVRLDRGRVEGNPVAEGDAGAQDEIVGPPVLRDVPRGREPGSTDPSSRYFTRGS